MPQELRVVRCFQCLKFQVDIVKKANKWICKVCGVKQSLMKEIFRGTGKECRAVVLELTAQKISRDEQEAQVAEHMIQNNIQLPKPAPSWDQFSREAIPSNVDNVTNTAPCSKWAAFVDEKDEEDFTDCLDLEKQMAQVSSTTFHRERVNVVARKHDDNASSEWNHFRQARDDEFIENAYGNTTNSSMNAYCNDGPARRTTNSATSGTMNRLPGQRSTAISFNSKVNHQISPPNDTRYPMSNGNCANPMGDFHRKNQPRGHSSGPSRDPTTEVTSVKRKHSATTTAPLMNFGKRPNNANVPARPTKSVNDCKLASVPNGHSKPKGTSESSSKWAKFLVQDDETDLNNDDIF